MAFTDFRFVKDADVSSGSYLQHTVLKFLQIYLKIFTIFTQNVSAVSTSTPLAWSDNSKFSQFSA